MDLGEAGMSPVGSQAGAPLWLKCHPLFKRRWPEDHGPGIAMRGYGGPTLSTPPVHLADATMTAGDL